MNIGLKNPNQTQVCPNISSAFSQTFLSECDDSVRDLSISKHKTSDIKWMNKHADTTHYIFYSSHITRNYKITQDRGSY